MKTPSIKLGLATAFAAALALGLAACSGDDSTNTPVVPHDSGTLDSTTPVLDGGNPGTDSGSPGTDSSAPNDAGNDVEIIDAALPDKGCVSEAGSNCNTCFTPQTDPVNGCSPAVVNCTKFDNSRVPTGAP